MNPAPYLRQSQIPSFPTSGTGDGGGGGSTENGGSTDTGGGGAATISGGAGADTLTGGAGGEEAPWFAGLPDDLKSQVGVTRHKTLTDAIQAGIAAEKRLGAPADQLLRLPTKPDDKEAYGAIYKALGAPENAAGYKFNIEGATEDDLATAAEFGKYMFDKGPYPPQFLNDAATFWKAQSVAAQAAADAEAETARTAAEAGLKTEWGAAYEPTVKEIGKLITDLGGKELADELALDTKIGNHPALAKFLKAIVDSRAESGPRGDDKGDLGTGKLTPGQATHARHQLESDPVKGVALRDASHPMHKAVVEERNKLFAMEHPQPTA